ncbi:hypothetical protein GPECTOR_15g367 [Gonium pectorale]|uniref:Protein kinase domain-containing protein n=1 Tax=Gonium pectorale TaxID=33097 RepID=A0A150GLH8_GONPE|nr:hypothetical protein GPECTOR_15g367 [Gonium pectorale]|eukprot:KXZ50683.1 hypothetical protein GPECTOR_15g367 [Gonium pectorale]
MYRSSKTSFAEVSKGPLFLSLTSNISLPAANPLWRLPWIFMGTRVVLLGDPACRPVVDLAGLEGAWPELDLGNLSLASGIARVKLTRCTLVLPDEELAFLRREAARGAGGGGANATGGQLQPGGSGSFSLELRLQQSSGGESSPGPHALDGSRLEVEMLQMMPQVLLLNCTLLSASAYAALPGAVELLPQSRVWPPLLLHGDEETAMTQGLSGQFALRRPVSLRNLVLYNLAPGGANGTGALPGGLEGPDAPWANSTLPLWLFSFDRSSPGISASSAQEPHLQPSGITFPGGRRSLAAAAATDPEVDGEEAPAVRAPLLSLHNVTLVVPEPEWRALVAAVLMQHAATELQAAQPLSYDPSSGTLVLVFVRHYGWTGTNVTILCALPPDAPPAAASLSSYPDLGLPYQDLAALNLDVDVMFRQAVETGNSSASEGAPGSLGDGASHTERPPTPGEQPYPGHPPPPPPGRSGSALAVEQVQPSAPSSASTSRPAWVVPVASATSAAGGLLLLLSAAGAAVFALRHRSRATAGAGAGGSNALEFSDPKAAKSSLRVQLGMAEAAAGTGGAASSSRCRGSCGSAEAGVSGGGIGGGGVRNNPTESQSQAVAPVSAWDAGALVASQQRQEQRERDVDPQCGGSAVPASSHAVPSQMSVSWLPLAPGDVGSERLDAKSFLRTMSEYYSEMRERLAPLPFEDTDGSPEPAGVELRPPRRRSMPLDMAVTIRALQAELGDAELRIASMLACGAYGVVYCGTWRGVPVAVKTLVVSGVTAGRAGRARQRAVLEAAISMSMAHPNIVATYHFEIKQLTLPPEVREPSSGSPTGGSGSPAAISGAAAANGFPDRALEAVGAFAAAGDSDEADAYKLYIVQEFCNGGSLQQALAKGAAGSVRRGGPARTLALRLALDVAQGMRHMHSCRIVHGDLKPDNVLLAFRPSDESMMAAGGASEQAARGACSQPSATRANNGAGADAADGCRLVPLTAKVADFGLSLPLAEGATHASKHFHGTPAYSAPEASAHGVSVIALGELSPRADVWSFGLMLLELFYGCTLSDMRGVQAMACSVREPGTVSLQDWLLKDMRESAHLQYAELAAACLSAEPRQRPDFGEICSRLQATEGRD